MQIASLLASAVQHLSKHRGTRKDFWLSGMVLFDHNSEAAGSF